MFDWFKKISINIKIALGFIFSIIAAILYFVIKGKIDLKNSLNYELSKLRSEIELEHLKEDSDEKVEALLKLETSEKELREKIEFIKNKEESGEEVTLAELDAFFDKRGF